MTSVRFAKVRRAKDGFEIRIVKTETENQLDIDSVIWLNEIYSGIILV
jgi:hypothetical protein